MQENKIVDFWDKTFDGSAEFNRFGIISVTLTIAACMGGITVGLGATASTFQLVLTVISTMTVLTLILGVQPVKWILNATVFALLIDVILIIYNLFIA